MKFFKVGGNMLCNPSEVINPFNVFVKTPRDKSRGVFTLCFLKILSLI
jgi:hypothetical protein